MSMLELQVRTQTATTDLVERFAARMDRNRESGQTSIEYLGIIVVIVAIVGLLAGAGFGGKIVTRINTAIDTIGGA